jgi:F0F1-type ATP synthase membrane subunit b/b'
MSSLMPIVFNFALFVVGLFILLRKPVREMVELRHFQLKDEVERVQNQLVESQRQLEEFETRSKTMDQERSGMIAFAKTEAEKQALKVINDAHRITKGIEADAGETAAGLRNQAVLELKNAFAAKVISKAELSLKSKLTGDDRVRILKDFSGKLEGMS